MVSEILIILFIIIVVLVFLLFFKTWNIHIIFNNDNFNYYLALNINFLFIQFNIEKVNSNSTIDFMLYIFSHKIQVFTYNLDSNENSDENDGANDEENSDNDEDKFSKIKEISLLLLDSKEELYDIIMLSASIIKFTNSHAELNIGLGDNYSTIKLCNLIWTLSAILYPLNFQLITIPKINETIIKSNGDITIALRLLNLLKILFMIIKNKNLRNLIVIGVKT